MLLLLAVGSTGPLWRVRVHRARPVRRACYLWPPLCEGGGEAAGRFCLPLCHLHRETPGSVLVVPSMLLYMFEEIYLFEPEP